MARRRPRRLISPAERAAKCERPPPNRRSRSHSEAHRASFLSGGRRGARPRRQRARVCSSPYCPVPNAWTWGRMWFLRSWSAKTRLPGHPPFSIMLVDGRGRSGCFRVPSSPSTVSMNLTADPTRKNSTLDRPQRPQTPSRTKIENERPRTKTLPRVDGPSCPSHLNPTEHRRHLPVAWLRPSNAPPPAPWRRQCRQSPLSLQILRHEDPRPKRWIRWRVLAVDAVMIATLASHTSMPSSRAIYKLQVRRSRPGETCASYLDGVRGPSGCDTPRHDGHPL